MPEIEQIMRVAKDAGASDVHITVGIPPKMRVNGKLITMDFPRMLPNDTMNVVTQIMSEIQLARFEERGEYDMSFSIPELGRYRVNAYKQRGSAAVALRMDWRDCSCLFSCAVSLWYRGQTHDDGGRAS